MTRRAGPVSPSLDQPLRLAVAARIAFGDESYAAALRTEARKGRLAIERIAGKDFVTLRAIEEMRAPTANAIAVHIVSLLT